MTEENDIKFVNAEYNIEP